MALPSLKDGKTNFKYIHAAHDSDVAASSVMILSEANKVRSVKRIKRVLGILELLVYNIENINRCIDAGGVQALAQVLVNRMVHDYVNVTPEDDLYKSTLSCLREVLWMKEAQTKFL